MTENGSGSDDASDDEQPEGLGALFDQQNSNDRGDRQSTAKVRLMDEIRDELEGESPLETRANLVAPRILPKVEEDLQSGKPTQEVVIKLLHSAYSEAMQRALHVGGRELVAEMFEEFEVVNEQELPKLVEKLAAKKIADRLNGEAPTEDTSEEPAGGDGSQEETLDQLVAEVQARLREEPNTDDPMIQ